jgi:hypothetical protein
MEYRLVFDVVEAGYNGWLYPMYGLAVGGAGGTFLAWRRARSAAIPLRSALEKWQPPSRDWLPYAFFGFILCLSVVKAVSSYLDYRAARDAELQGTAQTIEGTVSDFKPAAAHTRSVESFCVQDRCFSYSDGEPIHDGLQVRIKYLGDEIIRLEVAKDASAP